MPGSLLAVEATQESCSDAVEALGHSVSDYRFDDGWFGDTHVFGNDVECKGRDGELHITVAGKTVAEDGFYGPAALAARDAAMAIQSERIAELKRERDGLVSAAKAAYDRDELLVRSETSRQLAAVRNEQIPEALAARVQAAEAEAERERAEAQQRRAEQEAERVRVRAERDAAKLADEAEMRRKGFHCLSGLTGKHGGIIREVEKRLNDPSSFDHTETLVAPVNEDGQHVFRMKYRAKNAFGGLIQAEAVGVYSTNDCDDVQVLAIQ